MKCTVLLFAQLRETIGTDRLVIDLPTGSVVSDALTMLAGEHAPIAAMRNSIAVAVNERYAPMTTPLTDGCVIALITPVSGG